LTAVNAFRLQPTESPPAIATGGLAYFGPVSAGIVVNATGAEATISGGIVEGDAYGSARPA
jgi:hypothetical protein